MAETKSDKFIRLAESRTNEAIKKIRLIENLANKNNYDYNRDQARKIVKAIEKEVETLKQVYQLESDKNTNTFKLK